MCNYDAIIFDIDGTLWDATEANANGWNFALKEFGIENLSITASDMAQVAGKPYLECIDILLPQMRDTYPGLAARISELEAEFVGRDGGRFYSGVEETISQLANQYQIFLISNCHEAYMNVFLTHASFSLVIKDYDCNGMSNLPKSEMIKNMVTKHELKNPVYVGDTETDRLACEEADVDFIYVEYGFGNDVIATVTIDSLKELEEKLH